MQFVAVLLTLVVGQAADPAVADGNAAAGVSDRATQRIQAVVDTLGDLLKSIENEEATEEKNRGCFEQWCERETAQKATEADDDELRIEDLKVSLNEYHAAIARNTFSLEGDKRDVTDIQDAMAQAESIRGEEQEKYATDKAINMQSTSQLGDAIKIIKRAQVSGGFLQAKSVAGLQISAPGESSFVLGVFQSLEKNLVRNQQKADDIEQRKKDMYDQLHGGKSTQLQLVQTDIRTKQALIAEANQKQVDAQNDLTSTGEALSAGRAAHEDLVQDCEERTKEWAERQQDRQQEKAAIREAISFMTLSFGGGAAPAAPVPSFLQLTSMSGVSSSLSSLNEELSTLQDSVQQGQSKDHFESVKKVVTNLIGVMQKEEAEEEDKKRWCESEMEHNAKANETKTDQLNRAVAANNKGKSLIEELSLAANSINASITEMNSAQKQAETLRKDETAQFERATKDRTLASKVLEEATSVLRTFYASKKAGLVQTDATAAGRPEVATSDRHDGESNVVLAMLGKITGDIAREQKKAKEAEDKAQTAFEKYVLDCRDDFDSMMAEITEKVTRRAKLEVKLESSTEDADADTDTLKAMGTKMEAVNGECEPIVEHWDKRSKARLFEIDQLKDAFEILSGSQIAARTAFLTAERSFVAQKTSDSVLRQLQDTAKTVTSLVEEA